MSKRILLVEDEALIAMSESQVLKKHGYEVVTTHNGEEAVEAIDSDPGISLILMDIDLGRGMDGTEAAEEILTRHDVPIVFLTSHSEKEYLDRVKKISGYGYVLKNSGEFVLIESMQMAYTLFDANRNLRRENSARRATEEELTALYTHTPVLMLLVDNERKVRRANAVAGQFAGTSAEEMIGKRGGEALRCLHHLDDPRGCGFGPFCNECTVREIVGSTFANGEAYHRTEATLPFSQQGEEQELTFLVSTSLLHKANEDLCLVAFEDITDYKQLEEKYKALYENAPLPYQSLDNQGCFLEINPAWLKALGGYTREEVLGKPFTDFLHPDSIDDFTDNLEQLRTHGTAQDNLYRMRKKSGDYIEASFNGCISYTSGGTVKQTHCIFKDVTEEMRLKRELQESEKLFRQMFSTHHAIMLLIDPDTGEIVNANTAASRYYGFSVDELRQMTIQQINTMSAEEVAYERIRAAEEKRNHFFFSHRLSNGEIRDVEVHSTLIEIAGKKALFSIIHDITARKRAEDQLQHALQEKDFLMRELNHRIKNNLSMVSSLINLKASDADTDLSDIQRQIDSIGLIHEQLHQTESVTELRVRAYVGALLSSIFSSFTSRHVRIEEDIEDISIPTKSALSLGLVINEIATNAIKHGFTDTEEACFCIKMEEDRENGRYEVTLSNTGKPFPEKIDFDNPQTLGLRLVFALTAQLDGTMDLQRAPHPVFTMRFPIRA